MLFGTEITILGVDIDTIAKAGIFGLMVTSPLLIAAYVKLSSLKNSH